MIKITLSLPADLLKKGKFCIVKEHAQVFQEKVVILHWRIRDKDNFWMLLVNKLYSWKVFTSKLFIVSGFYIVSNKKVHNFM
jgi:hypothetical protein